jgi:hypothetical protein
MASPGVVVMPAKFTHSPDLALDRPRKRSKAINNSV